MIETAGNKIALVLDSTQISAFCECPRIWHYGYIKNYTIARAPKHKSRPIVMGVLAHRYLELYYKALANGTSQTYAIDHALAFNHETVCECGHTVKEHQSVVFQGVEESGCGVPSCDCDAYKHEPFPLEAVDIELVRKRIREYVYRYSNGDFRPLSPESVELGFSHRLFESEDRIYILEGKIDVLGYLFQQQLGFVDHKSQLRQSDLYKKSIQFRNYALAADLRMGLINYIRFTKKADETTYHREIISFTKPELDWWAGRVIKIYDKIYDMLMKANAADNDFWQSDESEPNWSACSGKFGYNCEFTDLCEEPRLAETKGQMLYQIKKEWRPW